MTDEQNYLVFLKQRQKTPVDNRKRKKAKAAHERREKCKQKNILPDLKKVDNVESVESNEENNS